LVPSIQQLATYINALGTGELLPRSGDFSGAGHLTPPQYSVSLVVSCLVREALRMILTDDKKTMMMIFH
jgi:hypothetical protein